MKRCEICNSGHFAELERDAGGVDFKVCGAPLRSELADSVYELGGDRAEKLSKSIWVLLLALASCAVLLTERVAGKGSPCIESSQSGICGLNQRRNEGGVESGEIVVERRACAMKKNK